MKGNAALSPPPPSPHGMLCRAPYGTSRIIVRRQFLLLHHLEYPKTYTEQCFSMSLCLNEVELCDSERNESAKMKSRNKYRVDIASAGKQRNNHKKTVIIAEPFGACRGKIAVGFLSCFSRLNEADIPYLIQTFYTTNLSIINHTNIIPCEHQQTNIC